MNVAKYLPVDMDRDTAAIFTAEDVFPIKRLIEAYDHICSNQPSKNVLINSNSGLVSFVDMPSISWHIYDVIAAYEYYKVAKESKFSFYKVTNGDNSVHLLISRQAQGCRFLVDRTLWQMTIDKDPITLQKLTMLIDGKITTYKAYQLYKCIDEMESGSKDYIDSIIVGRNTDDEYLSISPIKMPVTNGSTIIAKWEYEEMISILDGVTNVTENFKLDNGNIVRKNNENEAYSLSTVSFIKSQWKKIHGSKSNYYEIFEDNQDLPFMYVSTNFRYIVDGETFKRYVIKNKAIIDIVHSYVKAIYVDLQRLNTLKALLETNLTNSENID